MLMIADLPVLLVLELSSSREVAANHVRPTAISAQMLVPAHNVVQGSLSRATPVLPAQSTALDALLTRTVRAVHLDTTLKSIKEA